MFWTTRDPGDRCVGESCGSARALVAHLRSHRRPRFECGLIAKPENQRLFSVDGAQRDDALYLGGIEE